MKSARILLIMVIFLAGVGAIAWGAATFFGNRFKAHGDTGQIIDCSGRHPNRVVVIKNSKATPQHTYAPACDTLTITNQDDIIRLMAFGPHEHHVPYDGITEHVLGPDQSFTITLNAAGTFHFHDHIHDTVTGEFTVSPPQ